MGLAEPTIGGRKRSLAKLHERTMGASGQPGAIGKLERLLGRPPARRKPGPKPRKHKE